MESNTHLKKVKNFHDWDADQYKILRYHYTSCEGMAYMTRKKLVLDAITLNSGKALDIGCGPGIFTQDLLNKNLDVYSADLSIEMIKQAKHQISKHAFSGNAHFTVSDISKLCFSDNKMDILICSGVVCYLQNYNLLLSEIHRVLKPSGKIIIQIDNIRWPCIYKKFVPLYRYLKSIITSKSYDELNFDFNYFTYHNFKKDLEASGFRITNINYYDFRVPFIDIIFSKLSLKLGRIMFNNRHSKFLRCLSHGLLIEADKI